MYYLLYELPIITTWNFGQILIRDSNTEPKFENSNFFNIPTYIYIYCFSKWDTVRGGMQ